MVAGMLARFGQIITWRSAMIMFGLLFLNLTFMSPAQGLIPVFVEKVLERPPFFTSLVVSLHTVVYGAMLLVGGVLADRLGAKWTLVLGFCGAIAVGLMLRLQSPWWLLAIAPVYGMLFSFMTIGSRTYLARALPLAQMGIGGAVYFLCLTISMAVGSAIGGRIADTAGFGMLGLIAIIAGLVLVPLSAWLLPSVQAEPKDTESGEDAQHSSAGFADYVDMLRNSRILALCGLRFCATYFYGTMNLLLVLQIFRLTDSVTFVGLYGSAILFIIGPTQLVIGWAADKHGREGPVRMAAVFVLCGAVLITLFINNVWALAASGLLANMGAWWFSGLYPKLVVEAGPPEEQGRLIAITEFFWAVGILAGTMISGALASVFLRLPFIVCILVTIPMLLLALMVARGYHRAPDSDTAAPAG
jgi:MFS family permease